MNKILETPNAKYNIWQKSVPNPRTTNLSTMVNEMEVGVASKLEFGGCSFGYGEQNGGSLSEP